MGDLWYGGYGGLGEWMKRYVVLYWGGGGGGLMFLRAFCSVMFRFLLFFFSFLFFSFPFPFPFSFSSHLLTSIDLKNYH